MRKLVPLFSLAAALLTAQLLVTCSSPLESIDDPNRNPERPPDTTFIFDTVFQFDTVFEIDTLALDTVFLVDTVERVDTLTITDTVTLHDTVTISDTVIQFDTVFLTDTFTIVDTVIIFSDTCGVNRFCGRLNSHHREIIGLFQNSAGKYRLEFEAMTKDDRAPRDLKIDIDGQIFTWGEAQGLAFTLELNLIENAMIKISSTHSHGHRVTVCVTATLLNP